MFTNERHGVYLASVLSTVSLMAVVVLLPLAHQHFQRTMSVMLSNARQCQHQSAKMWHQLVSSPTAQMSGPGLRRPTRHSNIDGEKTNNKHADGVQHFKAACCACAQGPPGLRGPPGRDGINGRDEKPALWDTRADPAS
uniref:Col_cuticle_N domain-containing protein n=1 Tax=Globodera pallida TaxID=36090 RepID=A0A183CB73_GLOPA